MGRALKKRHTGTRSLLATDYTMCFDGVEAVNDLVAVPSASVFLGTEALLYQEPRAEVYKLFKDEGVGLKADVDLPEDHLSFELEFLALLSDRAVAALEQDQSAEALRNLNLSQEFITDNLLTWMGLLAERANQILKTRFYRGALKAVQGYLDLDSLTISDLIAELVDE
jgi:TorA maturation chaperone TorD